MSAEQPVFRGLTLDQLNHQYSPSRWVTRLPVDQVIAHHIAFGEVESQRARETVQHKELDVVYDPTGQDARVDVFHPNGGPTVSGPLLAFIHGGYWQALTKEQSAYFVRPLVDAGITVAVVGYDLCPRVTLAQVVQQAKRCVAFLHRRHPRNKIFVAGHSAGGHLAAMLLYVDWAREFAIQRRFLGGIFPISGVFDLTPIRICPAVNTDGCLGLTEQDVEDYSPLLLGARGDGRQLTFCPVVVAVGAQDPDEFRRQSRDYAHQLRQLPGQGPVVQLVEVPGRDHFDIMESLADPATPLLETLKNFCWQE